MRTQQRMESIDLIINDESIINDRGYRLLNSGLDRSRYENNPILLYQHDTERVIGRCEPSSLRIEGSKLIGSFIFDDKDSVAKEVHRKVEEGFLRGVSPGLVIYHMKFSEETGDAVDKWELFEVSVVSLPSNANAVKLYSKDLKPLNKEEEKAYIETLKSEFNNTKNLNNQMPQTTPQNGTITLAASHLQRLDLANVTTAEDAVLRLEALRAENTQLKKDIETKRVATRDAFIKDALKAGKITADQVQKYASLYDANEDLCRDVIGGLNAPQSITSQLHFQQGLRSAQGNEDRFAGSWDELEQKDLLVDLKATNLELFKTKWKEKFGTDFQY